MHSKLSDIPSKVLEELYRQHGNVLLNDKLLCRALLADQCGAFGTEIFVLASVLREGLLSASAALPLPGQARLDDLAQRIEKQLGFRADVARWAAVAWATALGWQRRSVSDRASSQRSGQASNATVSLKHSSQAREKSVDASRAQLIRGVLLAFRTVIERIDFPSALGSSAFAPPCDATVGIVRFSTFGVVQPVVSFCELGVHLSGIECAGRSDGSPVFMPFEDLQPSSARVVSMHSVCFGTPSLQLNLRGVAVRPRDFALLLNNMREVVAFRLEHNECSPRDSFPLNDLAELST
jgi:hypothetical protein